MARRRRARGARHVHALFDGHAAAGLGCFVLLDAGATLPAPRRDIPRADDLSCCCGRRICRRSCAAIFSRSPMSANRATRLAGLLDYIAARRARPGAARGHPAGGDPGGHPARLAPAPSTDRRRERRPMDRLYIAFVALGPFVLAELLSTGAGLGMRAMWGGPLWCFLGLFLVMVARPPRAQAPLRAFAAAWMIVCVLPLVAYAGVHGIGPMLKENEKRAPSPATRSPIDHRAVARRDRRAVAFRRRRHLARRQHRLLRRRSPGGVHRRRYRRQSVDRSGRAGCGGRGPGVGRRCVGRGDPGRRCSRNFPPPSARPRWCWRNCARARASPCASAGRCCRPPARRQRRSDARVRRQRMDGGEAGRPLRPDPARPGRSLFRGDAELKRGGRFPVGQWPRR